jgi:UDP-N-acetyl-D-mannosaminuronic acid dehydrogenase
LFGFANEIALVANEYGVSARQVIEAANYNYPRSNIALPGPSGGPCLEKDPWILAESGERVGVDLRISKASRMTNETFVTHYFRGTIKGSTSSLKIAILGLAFKGNPPSTDTRGSLTPTILKEVSDLIPNAEIYGYEPAGEVNTFKEFLSESNSIESVLLRADVIIIANNSESFRTVDLDIKKYSKEDAVIIDFWGYSKKSSLGTKQTLFSWAGE